MYINFTIISLMIRKLFRLLKRLLFLWILLVIWLFLYETIHASSSIEEAIGSSIEQARTEYNSETLETHVWYLETFTFEGSNIRYLDRGDRNWTPILLVHGTPTNSWLRRKMIPWLIATWYRVIAPDQFGFWMSDKGYKHEELTIELQSSRLIALMDHLNIQKFAIVWHDQWSLRVWETITKIPNRISHLVIMNSIWDRAWFHPPAGFGSENLNTKFTWWAMWSKMFGRIFAYGAMAGGLKNITHATPTMVSGYLYPLLNNMNNAYYDFITHFDEIEKKLPVRQEQFITLDIPTTIIRGKHDKILVGEEQAPVLAELFKVENENMHLLDRAAHFIQEESSEEIVTIMSKFIK